MNRSVVDVAIVGAGIVGLATARAIRRSRPDATIVVLDKEDHVGAHQSSHNSGVLHAGLYYRPGSDRARLCVEGREAMSTFCRAHNIPIEICGKVVVASSTEELGALDALHERARANGLDVRLLDGRGLAEQEPYADGVAALHVPATGIVDFAAVCRALADELREGSPACEVRLGNEVRSIDESQDEVVIETGADVVHARGVVTCAGLQSDRVARLAGADPAVTILPFRGEYYELVPERRHLVRNLLYPVPDPRFPFLGVHFTRGIDGNVHAGPNAVLALGRESYSWGAVDRHDVLEMARSPRAWRLAGRYWRTEVGEIARSLHAASFVRALQRLVPDVRTDDLRRAGSGVRAQAIRADGTLLDDFAFVSTHRTVNVVNAPSPAATASLAIGATIAAQLVPRIAE